MMLRKAAPVLVLLILSVVTVCSCDGGTSRLSPDVFASSCEKKDREFYVDYDEISGSLTNPRALEQGMYVRVSGYDIRRLLNDADVNALYADHGDEIPACLYSDDIDTMTLYIRSVSEEGSCASVIAAAVSLKVDADTDGYCRHVNESASRIIEEDGRDSITQEVSEDSGMRISSALALHNRNALTLDLYDDGDNVFVILACEFRTNAMRDMITELCGQMNITSPDLDGVDCTTSSSDGNRVLNLCEELGAVEVQLDSLDNLYDNKPFYIHSDSDEAIELSMMFDQEDSKYYSMIKDAVIVYDTSQSKDYVINTCKVVEFVFDEESDAAAFMKDATRSRQKFLKGTVISSDSGTKDGIEYCTFTALHDDFYTVYSYYCEGSRFYHFVCIMDTADSVAAKAEWIAGAMGFDR